MNKPAMDVIIPTYRPGGTFEELLRRLSLQTVLPARVIIMNTEEKYWEHDWERLISGLEVHHLTTAGFDHGGTRRQAAALSDGDIMVFMTQDALPADTRLLENLRRGILQDSRVGACYARQLPSAESGELERLSRLFNYPDRPAVRGEEDTGKYGIKTYFCSNVCAAYRKDVYEETGGFVEKTIFNEDMIYTGNMLKKGWKVAYVPDARVIHSHNYGLGEMFRRNFDLGVSQAEHPEIFNTVPSEGEGVKMISSVADSLRKRGKSLLILRLILESAAKYAGYLLGKHYRRLPEKLILRCTMNKNYWSSRH